MHLVVRCSCHRGRCFEKPGFSFDCGLEKEHSTWQVQRSIANDASVAISWNAGIGVDTLGMNHDIFEVFRALLLTIPKAIQ